MLLAAGGPYASGGRIDLRTGEVWPATALEDAWPGSEGELEEEDRWLAVWPHGSEMPTRTWWTSQRAGPGSCAR